jgi:hypothetical protein
MERRKPQDSKPVVAHNELAIVLGASRFDPAHINPDFLRYNEIVDATRQIKPPVIIESGFSLVEYNDGLTVTAINDSLTVSQTVQNLDISETVVPDVVRRYLAVAPWPVEYQYIHTDLTGSIKIAGEGFEPRFSPFSDLAKRVSLGDISPNVQVRAAYRFPDKAITMYVSEVRNEGAINELRFNAHMHRDISSDVSSDERGEFIMSILERWKDDTRDFDELACQFYFSYEQKED